MSHLPERQGRWQRPTYLTPPVSPHRNQPGRFDVKKNGSFSERPAPLEAPSLLPRRAAGLGAVFPEEIRSTRTPRAVLHWLLEGDPLRLRVRCEFRLRQSGLRLTLRCAWLRVAARVAHAHAQRAWTRSPAADWPAFAAWLDACIDAALQDLVEEQAELERCTSPLTLHQSARTPSSARARR